LKALDELVHPEAGLASVFRGHYKPGIRWAMRTRLPQASGFGAAAPNANTLQSGGTTIAFRLARPGIAVGTLHPARRELPSRVQGHLAR
jgi:hypothetical protein